MEKSKVNVFFLDTYIIPNCEFNLLLKQFSDFTSTFPHQKLNFVIFLLFFNLDFRPITNDYFGNRVIGQFIMTINRVIV